MTLPKPIPANTTLVVSGWHTCVQKLRLAHLSIALLAAVTGCSATNGVDVADSTTFRFQQSAADARTQIDRWAPVGATLSEATRALVAQGFTCAPTERPSQDVQSSTLCLHTTPADSIPGQRTTTAPAPVNWFITLDSKDGNTISAVQVARTPRDIGD